jgi:transcriptional regulator of acetoin/glycerol metabolism
VAGAGEDATYLLRLLPQPRQQSARTTAGTHRRRPRRHPDHLVEAVAELIHPVSAVNDQLVTAARSGSCMVIEGATGTGKRTVAEAVLRRIRHADDPPLVVDISIASRGEPGWYRQATEALDAGRGLILAHLQDLPRNEVNIVKAIAQRPAPAAAAGRGPAGGCAVVLTVSLADSPPHVEALVSQLGTPVELPSLRTISGSIPELVKQILADLPPGSRPAYVSTGALQALMRWDWPGNHAELRRTVQELAHRRPGQSIEVIHLPPRFRTTARTRSMSLLESAERDAIVETLHRTGGNRTQAAAALGIGRTTLYRKVRAYRIHE